MKSVKDKKYGPAIRMIPVLGAVLLGGCNWQAVKPINERHIPDRATYSAQTLPYSPPPHVEIINSDPRGRAPAPDVAEVVTGTWTFVTPETVTRVEQKTGEFSRYLLYDGRPAPTDTPFLVITISKDPRGIAQADAATYKIANQRDYALNGNLAHEWSGNTNTGAGFSELLIRRTGGETGDVCHVIAVAKTDAQRTMALDILGSITWRPER